MAGHRNLEDRVPPHDIEAEQSLLGACLLQRRPFEIAVELGMEAGHFYKPAHQYIFQAMTVVSLSGLQIDVVTLSAQLREVQMLDDVGGSSYLLSIQNATPSTSTAKRYAAIILETAQLRNLIDAAARATDLAYSGSDPLAAATTAQEMFAGIVEDTMGFTESRWPLYLTASDIVGQQRTDWAVHKLLLPQEVAIFTAGPGIGKSTLLRGLAYAAENSLDPWTTQALPGVERQRALVMDFETQAWNVKASSMRIRRDVAFWHGLDQSEVFEPAIVQHRGRIDVRNPRDMSEIRRHMRAVRPKLLCIGPLKNIHVQKPNETYEETALGVSDALMGLMAEFDCALAIESHGTKGDRGQTSGSERWLDWPDIAIGMEVLNREDCMDANGSRFMWWFNDERRHESDRLIRLNQRRYLRNEDAHIPAIVARQIGNGLPLVPVKPSSD